MVNQCSFHLLKFISGSSYLQLLQDQVIPHLRESCEMDKVWWQQDGAPPHYAQTVRQYLATTFDNRFISRGGSFEWPPRSPDLNPLDFFLWGYLKRKVYRNRPATIQQLKLNIENECRSIDSGTLHNVLTNCCKRMLKCKQSDGGHFEHLLR